MSSSSIHSQQRVTRPEGTISTPTSSPVKVTFNYAGQSSLSKQPAQPIRIPHLEQRTIRSSILPVRSAPSQNSPGSSIIRTAQQPQVLNSGIRMVRPQVSSIVGGRRPFASPVLLNQLPVINEERQSNYQMSDNASVLKLTGQISSAQKTTPTAISSFGAPNARRVLNYSNEEIIEEEVYEQEQTNGRWSWCSWCWPNRSVEDSSYVYPREKLRLK